MSISKDCEGSSSLSGRRAARSGYSWHMPVARAVQFEPWNGSGLVKKGGWPIVGPSAIAFQENYGITGGFDGGEASHHIVEEFRTAAHPCDAGGFKVVEIHAAHGYLVHQFLSPLSNRREDNYGGSFDNRVRLLLEITDAVRAVWPAGYPSLSGSRLRIGPKAAGLWRRRSGWPVC